MNEFEQVTEMLEQNFERAKGDAVRELNRLVGEAQLAIKNIEDHDGFVSTFAGGGVSFDGSKALAALANLAAAREAVGAVR